MVKSITDRVADYILVEELYTTREQRTSRLTDDKIESTILNEAMQFYDLSTNGNRTRGSMKKCSDMYVPACAPKPHP